MDNIVNSTQPDQSLYEPVYTDIRIFLSSTFCDLQDERSVIVNKVAPALNERYKDLGLKINIVDLRWGVTEKDARNGKVIEICLREIDKSKPYFASIIGGRYGWQPGEEEIRNNSSICSAYPDVLDDIMEKRSITEIEIQYAFLKNKHMEKQAMFFLKDLDYVPYDNKDSGQAMEHLKLLRETITQKAASGLCSADTFTTPESLGEIFYARLCEVLDRDFPREESMSSIGSAYKIQNSLREYETRIGERLGWTYIENTFLDMPNKYIRFQFMPSHARDILRYILAELSFKKIAVKDPFDKEFPEDENGNPAEYRFIPIDIDPRIDTAEKFLQMLLFINGLYECKLVKKQPYEDSVEAVKALSPSCPIICIIRDMDNLPASELSRLAFLADTDEWLCFIISCREASIDTLTEKLGLNSDNFSISQQLPRLNIQQSLKIIDTRLSGWSKALSEEQRLHLLLCPSFSRFHLLNIFLEIINRFGYYEKLDEIIDRFVMTRSDEDFIDVALDMYEQELDPEAVRWLLIRIATDNDQLDEATLRDAFIRQFRVNALEWASYADMLENMTDKISSYYHINDISIMKALGNRYGIDVSTAYDEGQTEEERHDSNARHPQTHIGKENNTDSSEEYPFIANAPVSIQELVPYAEIRMTNANEIRSILKEHKDNAYPGLLKKIKEASLLNQFISKLKESGSDESLITLLWVALSEIAPDVKTEDLLLQITHRLNDSEDPGLQKAFYMTMFIFARHISGNAFFKNPVEILTMVYDLYPKMGNIESTVLSIIAGTTQKNIRELPDMSGICDFTIRWLSDDLQGRFGHFIQSLAKNFSEVDWEYRKTPYIEFLSSFAEFYSKHSSSYKEAYYTLLLALKNILNNLQPINKGSFGKLMLKLGYDIPEARIAILEEKVRSLGTCHIMSERQEHFFSTIKELYSYKDYMPPADIREKEICNLLMTKRFTEADAVSRVDIPPAKSFAFDFLESVFKGEWDHADAMIEADLRHEFALKSGLYFEAADAIKVSTLLVLLYTDGITIDGIMEKIDRYWDAYNDSCIFGTDNYWSLRKLISAIFMQRLSMYDDADEMFRQACLPQCESDGESDGTDTRNEANDMQLLRIMQCIRKNEIPPYVAEYIDIQMLEYTIIVPASLAIVYLSEKAERLNKVSSKSYGETVALLESIRFSKLLDLLLDCRPDTARA